MASNTKAATPSYMDFVPDCEFKKEEAHETLIINLPDFKKEEMRVQVNKEGVVKVTGEKPANAAGTKRKRFLKETKVPQNCDINYIRAKFINGRLHIVMPKRVTAPPAAPQAVEQPASTSLEPPQQEAADQKSKEGASTSYDQAKGNDELVFKYKKSMLQKLQGNNKVILGFGIAAVTMVAIGAFVASKYGSDNDISSSYSSSASSLYMED